MLCVGLKLNRPDNDKESVQAKNDLQDLSGHPFFDHEKHQVRFTSHEENITGWDLRNLMKRVVSEGQSASQGKIVKPRTSTKHNSSRNYLRALRPKTSSSRPPVSYSQPISGNMAVQLPVVNPEVEVFRHRASVIPSRVESLRQSTSHNSANAISPVKRPLLPARVCVNFFRPEPAFLQKKQPLKTSHPRSEICNFNTYKQTHHPSAKESPHRRIFEENWKRQQMRIHKQHQSYLQQINQLLGQQHIRLDQQCYAKRPAC